MDRAVLLQAPFCVHPKTGKVCVPIDPAASAEFDPDAVPTLASVVAAADQRAATDGAKVCALLRVCSVFTPSLQHAAICASMFCFAVLCRIACVAPPPPPLRWQCCAQQ
jgi:hypothetical protein